MTTEELTGSALEIQRAIEKLRGAYGDLYTAFNSAGTAAAASVMVLVLSRIEVLEHDLAEVKARLAVLEGQR